jgi:hypothetical protein
MDNFKKYKNFVEMFDDSEKCATEKMWEIINNFKFYLSPFHPFPEEKVEQEIVNFKYFVLKIPNLHLTTRDSLVEVLRQKLHELKESHSYIPTETPIHDMRLRKKKLADRPDKGCLNSELIKEVLLIGCYDDFAKNILNEMLNGKREYKHDFVVSHLC